MVVIVMNMIPSKVIGKNACLWAKDPLSCQRIVDPKGAQTLKGGRNQKNEVLYEGEKMRCNCKRYEGRCMKQ
jgi:hypothetical protein